MEQALTLHALDRIEAALARLEASLDTAALDTGPNPAADLQRRHDDLKACVARSLAGLDELLAQRDGR